MFYSCQKDVEKLPDEPSIIKCKITKIYDGNYSNFFEYDDSNRIIKNTFGYIKKYDYSKQGEVFIVNFGWEDRILILLNSEGNAISKSQKYLSETPDVDQETVNVNSKFTYSSNGYIVNEVITSVSTHVEYGNNCILYYSYEYIDGNMSQCKMKDQNGNESIWSYTYYPELQNQLDELQQKLDFKGKKNKNLIKTREEIKGGNSVISTYKYTFDNEGKLATQTISSPGSNDMVNTYTWTCK